MSGFGGGSWGASWGGSGGRPAPAPVNISEVLGITEGLTLLREAAPAGLFETVTLTEGLALPHTTLVVTLETIGVTEGLTQSRGVSPALVNETIVLSEASQITQNLAVLRATSLSSTLVLVEFNYDLDYQYPPTLSLSNYLIDPELDLLEVLPGPTNKSLFLLTGEQAEPPYELTIVAGRTSQGDSLYPPNQTVLFGDNLLFTPVNNTSLRATFPNVVALPEAVVVGNYRVEAAEFGAFPMTVLGVTPEFDVLHSGITGQVVEEQVGESFSTTFDTVVGVFTSADVGRYLRLTGTGGTSTATSPAEVFQIVKIPSPGVLQVDRPLPMGDPANGTYVPGSGFTPGTGELEWEVTSGVESVLLTVSKGTNGKSYRGYASGLRFLDGRPYASSHIFTAQATKPQVDGVEFLPEDGSVKITFTDTMRVDGALLDPTEYALTGPTDVEILRVTAVSPVEVCLHTTGFGVGSYTLTVNATGTPKDEAGNPTDPGFNTAVFTASLPVINRSIFTDKGPISRPALTLQSGTGGTIQTYTTSTFGPSTLFTSNEIVAPGASFSNLHVGLYLVLAGTTVNAGKYRILQVINPTRVKLEANLRLPDVSNGAITWELVDPRIGQIADDPADVVVLVNGTPVVAEAVIGLLGQVVLPTAPDSTDDVKINYSYIPKPTVEIRRLNSREFRLNAWNDETGHSNPSQHSYRYRNVLVDPEQFIPDDMQAHLVQPLLRELNYHAFERVYSVALNDPKLLVLNSPIHRIAYPPLSREIPSVSVAYTADVLPETDADPWDRKGVGLATILGGSLEVRDNTGGPYPTGNPLFWTKSVDLTFPHVFAATWRMQIDFTTPTGVFTGIAMGWSNDQHAVVLGFLDDAGVRKIGFLKQGFGNDPASIASWTSTFVFDWSVTHSYRIFRSRDGVVKVYVDGQIVESGLVLESECPFLEEFDDPFVEVQNVFFGSISRTAANISLWDFVRYLVLPTNPAQSTPSVFSSYEGNVIPEVNATPWTPIGYHGVETIIGSSALLLDSTSATNATEAEVGLIGGDFRGYTRLEPLLAVSSDVVVDFDVQLRTLTHGITPNALMVAVDDGDRLVQVSFFPSQSKPKFSYPGRTLPGDATPVAWQAMGAATAEMIGQTLRITDETVVNGLVYYVNDFAPIGDPNRVIETNLDYLAEMRLQVRSYTDDGSSIGFCGATLDVFDGTRALGVMLRKTNTGTLQIAFHSDGTLLGVGSQYDFNWNDGLPHTIRISKSTGGNLVSLFVDGTLLGTFAYSSFSTSGGNPTISFGSATISSVTAKSVVDWYYVNTWAGQTGGLRYVGIWKGYDANSLTGYHLPLKSYGHAVVAGNTLADSSAAFITAGVAVGDHLVVDVGTNKGTYTVASVSATTLTTNELFLTSTNDMGYRVVRQTDWTAPHQYRIVRDPGGSASLFLDGVSGPYIQVDYNSLSLPSSAEGLPGTINNRIPSITWGAFDPTNISQTAWDYVRYGITSSPTEDRIVPHHQVLNQRNVMASPEHLTTSVVHGHTQFSSASTGIPYPWQEFVDNPAVKAFTKLNEGTPLVPSTQTYEVRSPTPVSEFVSGLNRPEDVLNSDGDFLLNDASVRTTIIVPDDVLYNCLEVNEKMTGEVDHLAPFSDEWNPIVLGKLNWTREVCGTYEGNVLPQQDPGFGTPWVLESDVPGDVSTTVFGGALTYSTGSTPNNNTIYRNLTPLTDPAGLQTRVDFKFRVLNDSSSGTGDSGIRMGFNAFGLTAALAFVTTTNGDREVQILDLNANEILGATPFDFLDGAYHVYRLEKNVAEGTLELQIDP